MSPRNEIINSLSAIFSDVFEDSIRLSEDDSPKTIFQWTSLNHTRLISAIEKHFGITISFFEARQLNSIDAIVNLIISRTFC